MSKHPLYDAAVAEVRGEALPHEVAQLSSNVFDWRDALLSVVDEVNAQVQLKDEEYRFEVEELRTLDSSDDGREEERRREEHSMWRNRALRFRKHVKARLDAVKRMCRDQLEGSEEYTYDLEKAMRVVSAASELIDADAEDDAEQFDEAFDQLEEVVRDYRTNE